MTHKELKDRIKNLKIASHESALLAVVELHKPNKFGYCEGCDCGDPFLVPQYPCPTIQAIEKELK